MRKDRFKKATKERRKIYKKIFLLSASSCSPFPVSFSFYRGVEII